MNQILHNIYFYFTKKSLKLKAHKQEIKCMKFSRENGTNLLCSCSSDLIIVWNIRQLIESKTTFKINCFRTIFKLNFFKAKFLQGKNVIIENLSLEPTQCCFHPNNQIIGICYGEKISLFDLGVNIYSKTK